MNNKTQKKKTYPKRFTDLELLGDSIRNTFDFAGAFSTVKDTGLNILLRNRIPKDTAIPYEMFDRDWSMNLRFMNNGCFVSNFIDRNCRADELPINR